MLVKGTRSWYVLVEYVKDSSMSRTITMQGFIILAIIGIEKILTKSMEHEM